MRVKLERGEELHRFVALLQFDPDAIVTRLAGDELEISYVGSFSERAQRERLAARLRSSWLSEWELVDGESPDPLPDAAPAPRT